MTQQIAVVVTSNAVIFKSIISTLYQRIAKNGYNAPQQQPPIY